MVFPESGNLDHVGLSLGSCGLAVARDVPMRDHTTWKIGGPADVLVEPHNHEQMVATLRAVRVAGIPHVVMGGGSNLLFADEGFRGVVIKLGTAMGRIELAGTRLTVEAGASTCRMAWIAYRNGLTGLEPMMGIPGSLGGLVAMNGGSRRQGIGEWIDWVDALDERGETIRLEQDACRFSYRTSLFLMEPGWMVVRCGLSLPPGDPAAIRRAMLTNLRERRRKYPLKWPSCGSVFKSSPELFERAGPPGKIIEMCGFKGQRAGEAYVSPLHANFIIHAGNARAGDVLTLICRIREAVHARYGVWMETEARYVRPGGGVVPAHEAA